MDNQGKYDATHRRLIACGVELFVEHGFENVTAAQIARAAGISRSNFYLHFKSRQQLVYEWCVSPESAVVAGSAQEAADPWVRFVRHELAHITPACDQRTRALFAIGLAYSLEGEGELHCRGDANLVSALKELQKRGIIKNSADASYLANAVAALRDGFMYQCCSGAHSGRVSDYFWSLEAVLQVDDLYRGIWKEEENYV